MELILKGEPKEIAALLIEAVKRQMDGDDAPIKNPGRQNLSGDEIDPYHLPVVVALSARELELLKVEYAEKANRSKDDRKTQHSRF